MDRSPEGGVSFFITLEGPEGSGKSTQAPLLARRLIELGYEVLLTREPGGTAIGDQIRAVLHSLQNTDMQPRTEMLLLAASRAQLVEQVIRPALAAGKIVISDRYADSTLAYQGYGHQLEPGLARQLVAIATGGLKPDLTLLFDLEVEEGLGRRRRGEVEWNRLDAYDLAFHRRVRAGYHALVKEEPARWAVIDAAQPVEVVSAQVARLALERLRRQPAAPGGG